MTTTRMPVAIIEAGPTAGASVLEWGHVRLFSPWRYNVDQAAEALLRATGWTPPDPDTLPTGRDLVERYLAPLADLPQIRPHLRLCTRVLSVTRRGADKMKTQGREDSPFVLRVETPEGEASVADRVFYGIPDALGAERSRYAGRRVLVALREPEPATEVTWVVRRANVDRLFGGGAADKLPARGGLGSRVRALVGRDGVHLVEARLARLARTAEGVAAFDEAGEPIAVADEVVGSPASGPTSRSCASCGSTSTASFRRTAPPSSRTPSRASTWSV